MFPKNVTVRITHCGSLKGTTSPTLSSFQPLRPGLFDADSEKLDGRRLYSLRVFREA